MENTTPSEVAELKTALEEMTIERDLYLHLNEIAMERDVYANELNLLRITAETIRANADSLPLMLEPHIRAIEESELVQRAYERVRTQTELLNKAIQRSKDAVATKRRLLEQHKQDSRENGVLWMDLIRLRNAVQREAATSDPLHLSPDWNRLRDVLQRDALGQFPTAEQDPLRVLMAQFSAALYEKAVEAGEKRKAQGMDPDGWRKDDWADFLRFAIRQHIEKGDPRDVGVYAAFAWHHEWSTGYGKDCPFEDGDRSSTETPAQTVEPTPL